MANMVYCIFLLSGEAKGKGVLSDFVFTCIGIGAKMFQLKYNLIEDLVSSPNVVCHLNCFICPVGFVDFYTFMY